MDVDKNLVFTWVLAAVETYSQANGTFPAVELHQDRVRQDGDWFYVSVARKPPYSARSFPFFDQLRDIEDKLQEEHSVNVLLVPTIAA